MNNDLIGNLINQTALQIGGLSLSLYQIGAAVLSIAVAFLAVGSILVLVNLDGIAYYNHTHKQKMKDRRRADREKAYKAHMKRVRRYEAHLREERGY